MEVLLGIANSWRTGTAVLHPPLPQTRPRQKMKDYKQKKLFKTDFNFKKQLEKKLHFTLDLEGYSMKGLMFFCKTNCIFSPCLHELLQQDQQYLRHEEKLELC